MHSQKRKLLRLEAELAAQQDVVAELQAQGDVLRMRLAAIQLAWRVQHEAKSHRARCTAEGAAAACAARPRGGHQACCLEQLRLEAIEALGFGFSCLQLDSGVVLRGCGRAQSASPLNSGSSSGIAFACGGAAGGGGGGGGGSSDGSAGAGECRDLLGDSPHLAPAASLLHLDSVSPAAVAAVRSLDAAGFRAAWTPLVASALQALECAGAEPRRRSKAAAEQLRAAGLRMKQLSILMVMWSFDTWVRSCTVHVETQRTACGEADAPLCHWEHVVRALQLTRAQAQLLVESHRMMQARLEELNAERLHLFACLRAGAGAACREAPPPAAFSGGPGPFAAALLGAALWRPPRGQQELVAALEANVRNMRAAMGLSALLTCAVLTPEQWAAFMALSYPWPPHVACCVSVLQHDLRFRPEAFARHAAGGGAGAGAANAGKGARPAP